MFFNNAFPNYLYIPPKRNADENQRFKILTMVKIQIILRGRSFYDAVGNSDYNALIYGNKVKVTLSLFTT